jgi:hypothetical protein
MASALDFVCRSVSTAIRDGHLSLIMYLQVESITMSISGALRSISAHPMEVHAVRANAAILFLGQFRE